MGSSTMEQGAVHHGTDWNITSLLFSALPKRSRTRLGNLFEDRRTLPPLLNRTTLCRYINYKWVSINISYICHVEHHMTPAIDKRGIITYSYHKERTKKIKKK